MMGCEKNCTCECCNGVRPLTPEAIYNRPGLDSLAYRAGVHGSFFETMKARLASSDFPALEKLGARTTDDPSIALLDGWATVADVLTFYQERLANEGFLRTATERRSVLELARLIGYTPRPGVASTVYLAYEIDKNADKPTEIPIGSKVQSLPGPGELPQTFETVEKFMARREWNAIKPRVERQNSIFRIFFGTDTSPGARVYLKGISTGLAVNDPLLIHWLDLDATLVRVSEVTPDPEKDVTLVRFTYWDGSEIKPSPDVQIRRALLEVQEIPLEQYPEDSLERGILLELDFFLTWFYEQSIAPELDPEVEVVLNQDVLMTVILSTMDDLRETVLLDATDDVLVNLLKFHAEQVAQISSIISEYTEMSGGGVVGEQTDAMAERLLALEPGAGSESKADARTSLLLKQIVTGLAVDRSVPPRDSQSLERDPANLFDFNSDVGTQAVGALEPKVATQLATAVRNAKVSPDVPVRVYALRQKSLLFGSSAPRKVTSVSQTTGVVTTQEWTDADIAAAELTTAIHLDTPQEKIQPGTWVVLDYSGVQGSLGGITIPTTTQLLARAGAVQPKMARAQYSLSGQTTQIALLDEVLDQSLNWFTYTPPPPDSTNVPAAAPAFQLIRQLAVFIQSEELPLGVEPLEEEICGGDDWIETNGLYSGLETGRWLVVSGERSDVDGTEDVRGSELVMLAAVQNYVQKLDVSSLGRLADSIVSTLPLPTYEPGEKLHTFIKLAAPLAYCYKRDTVEINANVVKATHGETRNETLGSGDTRVPLQTFALKQPPLTFIPANEPDGISSTLNVYVNGVKWREADALVALGPTDRGFMTKTNDDGTTSVVFGNGQRGARLPTGVENVKAIYRSGIGKPGNVKAGQISQLLSRPLGVKGVNNPIEASGGADRETRDQARKNAPLAVMALDRLVGTRDYADFARTFAGIAKAVSAEIFAGGGGAVYVTIAGIDDIPVPPYSDLFANLIAALRTYGDPSLPVHVQSRELLMLVLSARISIHEDYLWEDVVERVRAGLLDRYSFERQELGRSVPLSDAVAFIQNQRGVQYVDIEAFGAVSQVTSKGEYRSPQEISTALKEVIDTAAQNGRPAAVVQVHGIRLSQNQTVLPAQLAYLLPSLPESLILNRIEE